MKRSNPLLALFALCPALALLDCSFVVAPDRQQCSTNQDCTQRGPDFAGTVCADAICVANPQWSCLDKLPVTAANPGPFHLTMHLVDLVTRQPVSGVSTHLCNKIDVTCASARDSAMSDDSGQVAFVVEGGFTGYLSLEKAGMRSTLYFINPPVVGDVALVQTMATQASSDALAGQFGTPILADHGIVVITASDCVGGPAEGVNYAPSGGDEATAAFYVVGGLPTTQKMATDATGAGGLINVPPGNIAVTGTLADHRTVGTVSVLVRSSVTTYTRMVPLAN